MTAGVALTPWKDVGDKNRGVDERTTKMNYTTSALSGDGPITVIYKTGTAILLIDWRAYNGYRYTANRPDNDKAAV